MAAASRVAVRGGEDSVETFVGRRRSLFALPLSRFAIEDFFFWWAPAVLRSLVTSQSSGLSTRLQLLSLGFFFLADWASTCWRCLHILSLSSLGA